MADHLLVLEREGTFMGAFIPRPEIPVVVISSGDQPAEQIAAHRMLAERSDDGRHVIAARSAHWVQFDEPELVVAQVRELVQGR
jgi:pimeloyl-ACP methyl ester carboxylesterase